MECSGAVPDNSNSCLSWVVFSKECMLSRGDCSSEAFSLIPGSQSEEYRYIICALEGKNRRIKSNRVVGWIKNRGGKKKDVSFGMNMDVQIHVHIHTYIRMADGWLHSVWQLLSLKRREWEYGIRAVKQVLENESGRIWSLLRNDYGKSWERSNELKKQTNKTQPTKYLPLPKPKHSNKKKKIHREEGKLKNENLFFEVNVLFAYILLQQALSLTVMQLEFCRLL